MSDPRSFRTGWLLDPDDRAVLLVRFPPHYAEVVAHHVTLRFGDHGAPPVGATAGEVVGVADDGEGVEALVVRIGGTTERPDGSTYHITWSLAPGREAHESNAVIARLGWSQLEEPVPVQLEPKTFEG